jgi:hypothetical protein
LATGRRGGTPVYRAGARLDAASRGGAGAMVAGRFDAVERSIASGSLSQKVDSTFSPVFFKSAGRAFRRFFEKFGPNFSPVFPKSGASAFRRFSPSFELANDFVADPPLALGTSGYT